MYTKINPLLLSSLFFYICAYYNYINGYLIESLGMSIVASTSVLYHSSYCICINESRCNCNGIMRLFDYKNLLKYVDMIPNFSFGTIFTLKAIYNENYSRVFWAVLGLLGYMVTNKNSYLEHFIWVHVPVIFGFMTYRSLAAVEI